MLNVGAWCTYAIHIPGELLCEKACNAARRLPENAYFSLSMRQVKIIFLEIQYMSGCPVGPADRTGVVIIFNFLWEKEALERADKYALSRTFCLKTALMLSVLVGLFLEFILTPYLPDG